MENYLKVNRISKLHGAVFPILFLSNRFDLWVDGSLVVSSVLKEIKHSPNDVEQVVVLDRLELYLAFSRKTPETTIQAWEDALRWLKKEGTFSKISRKWLPLMQPPMNVVRLGTTSTSSHP